MRSVNHAVTTTAIALLAACTNAGSNSGDSASTALPRPASTASTRHGEWAMIGAAPGDSVRAWIVYPERRTKAPVVVVVHENSGLTSWARGVADQLAAAGFIAVAPDLLSHMDIPGAPDNPDQQAATTAMRALSPDFVHRHLRSAAEFGMALPAAKRSYGVVGFCWGGGVSFEHAVRYPDLGAAVVYYGASPAPARLATVRAPVLGLYGGDDARINATVPPADSAMHALGKTFRPITYAGAGHGFLRQLDANEANGAAAAQAWPETIAWFRRYLER